MKHVEPKAATILAATLATEPDANPTNYRACAAAKDAESLIRLGKRAARIAEQRCNGIERYDATARRMLASWTDEDEARADKACERIAAQARDILGLYSATAIKVGGDPRGFNLTFRLASGRSNSFGGEVWGV